METIFSADYKYIWMVALALALFLPVRQLIYVLQVRRAASRTDVDEAEMQRLKKRATVTSALLCFVFSFLYMNHLFQQ